MKIKKIYELKNKRAETPTVGLSDTWLWVLVFGLGLGIGEWGMGFQLFSSSFFVGK